MNYYANTNRLKSVADGMGGTGDNRNMGDVANFVYDSEGNLTEDKSKQMKIAYDWRGKPVEFVRRAGNGDSLKLAMLYDGGGRRISKTRLRKGTGAADWSVEHVTHYTGIGTEVREYKPWNFVRFTDSQGVEHCISANPDYAGTASTTCPLPDTVRVVVPLPNGLGRHALQNAAYEEPLLQGAYEFYLKDHLGSTRVVYGVGFPDPLGISPNGVFRAAYDYRSFGEQLDQFVFSRKVTENFTGKERDDETALNYFGARYLDPMLGLWTSVDPARQFASPYLYVGNGMNPIGAIDPDGNASLRLAVYYNATANKSTQSNVSYNANQSVQRLQRYISNRVNTDVDQVEVKAFASGNHMEMQAWLNGGDVRAIMTHGGPDRMYITDVPYTDGLTYEEKNQHRFDYSDMNRLLKPTFIGQCYGKENIDTEKYPNLIPPNSLGEVEVEKATAEYLIDNSTKELQ